MIKVSKNNVEEFIKDYYKTFKKSLYIKHIKGNTCYLSTCYEE